MKAAWFEKFGNAEDVLNYGDFETPRPDEGEVLVRLQASGINPSDTKKRAGSSPALLKAGPVIPHSDGAGIIETVGPGVPDSRVGEHVWVYNAQFGRQHGTAAEYVALDSSQAVWMPEKTGFDVGACMGIPAMTSHRCVTADGPVDGQTILVTGGAGRVGYYAIQWAKQLRATVIATASSDEGREDCLTAGADLVTGHPGEETTAAIKDYTKGLGVDRVVEGEFGGNLNHILKVLKTNGTIATYSSMAKPTPEIPFYQMMFMDITVRYVLVYVMPDSAKQQAAKDISDYLEQEKLQHRVAHTIPLSNIAHGHKLIEDAGFPGCVVLNID
ncbi:NADPH:quinone reductase [bacterium]|nr:NADPH:quinone reductase [bacterium]